MRLAVAVRERRPERSSSANSVAIGEREQGLEDALKSANLKTRRLEIETARLRDELEQVRSEKPKSFVGEAGLPLFAPDLLTARVLDAPATDEIERTILTLDEGHMAPVSYTHLTLPTILRV